MNDVKWQKQQMRSVYKWMAITIVLSVAFAKICKRLHKAFVVVAFAIGETLFGRRHMIVSNAGLAFVSDCTALLAFTV